MNSQCERIENVKATISFVCSMLQNTKSTVITKLSDFTFARGKLLPKCLKHRNLEQNEEEISLENNSRI